jgi:hypothetical protein
VEQFMQVGAAAYHTQCRLNITCADVQCQLDINHVMSSANWTSIMSCPVPIGHQSCHVQCRLDITNGMSSANWTSIMSCPVPTGHH